MHLLNDNALKQAQGQEKDVIVFLGNIKDSKTSKRHDEMLNFGIGVKNFDIGFTGQLLMKCPKTKVQKLMKKFPIVEGGGYWQTTHRWSDEQ